MTHKLTILLGVAQLPCWHSLSMKEAALLEVHAHDYLGEIRIQRLYASEDLKTSELTLEGDLFACE